jgi:hypothetical protein
MKRPVMFALTLLLSSLLLAPSAQALVGIEGEITYARGPGYPANPNDSQPAFLAGLYWGTSGLEIRPSALFVNGQYEGILVDGGVRITPKWFGFDEYLFGMVSPYVVGHVSYSAPFQWGYGVRGGLGVGLMEMFSINAEIGYRSHRFNERILLEGTTISARVSLEF